MLAGTSTRLVWLSRVARITLSFCSTLTRPRMRCQYKKLLDLCPDDIEAKIYTVLLNPMNLGFDTEGEGKRTEAALDVFVADLKESSLPFEEKEALITFFLRTPIMTMLSERYMFRRCTPKQRL